MTDQPAPHRPTMPQELTQIEPQPVAKPPQVEREARISKRLRKAIELLESGECATQKAAAVRVGMSDTYLCRALKKSSTQVFIARRRAENIARASLRASYRFGELVNAESEHVALRAVERALETSGDLRSSSSPGVSLTINNHAGFVIDISGDAPMRHTSPPDLVCPDDDAKQR